MFRSSPRSDDWYLPAEKDSSVVALQNHQRLYWSLSRESGARACPVLHRLPWPTSVRRRLMLKCRSAGVALQAHGSIGRARVAAERRLREGGTRAG
jgi:hypothetical protein